LTAWSAYSVAYLHGCLEHIYIKSPQSHSFYYHLFKSSQTYSLFKLILFPYQIILETMPPSIRYINQYAPFWDFVASMEDGEHPMFGQQGPGQQGPGPWGPWGRRGHHTWHHHQHGMPHRGPPEANTTNAGPSDAQARNTNPTTEAVADEKDSATAKEDDVEMENKDIPDPPEDTPRESCDGERRRKWGQGGRRCGGRGMRGNGWEHGWHGHGHGHGHGQRHHPYGPPPPAVPGWSTFAPGFRMLNNMFNPQEGGEQGDWQPEADVFDTPSAYVVHVSLPGANKEDVGCTWDPERSELEIAGVVHRPGDEEFLKTLALDERHVGAFERKVRLGSRAHPAHVDVDGIFAKLENGILIVEVPKMIGEFVEVKKVDIE
jgi:HSP20 family protein